MPCASTATPHSSAPRSAHPPPRRRKEVNATSRIARLRATCQRALRNYLARAGDNLNADLTADAAVALPGLSLSLHRLTALQWAPDGASVLASLEASDGDGVSYALRYELDVRRVDQRWEIAAIQTDPTT